MDWSMTHFVLLKKLAAMAAIATVLALPTGAPVGNPYYESFGGGLNLSIWTPGYLRENDPITWNFHPDTQVGTSGGSAFTEGAWRVNSLLGLKGVNVAGKTVLFRAWKTEASFQERTYQIVLSAQPTLTQATSYELAFQIFPPAAPRQAVWMVDVDTTGLVKVYANGVPVGSGNLPGAKWIYFMEGNEGGRLWIDDVIVDELV